MKKLLSLCLVLFVLILLTATASASTIPIEVTPGVAVQLSGCSLNNSLGESLKMNLNSHLALSLEYVNPANYFTFSTRYAFTKNFAVAFSYSSSSPVAWNADLRMKYDVDSALAVVSLLGFDGSNPYFTGQTEYWFNEQFAGNMGINYQNSGCSLVVGGEFRIHQLDIGLDYNSNQSQMNFYVAYQF